VRFVEAVSSDTIEPASSVGDAPTDGRRQRTERSRVAVIDAVFELLREGRVPPTAEEIAERSGVSVSSIFRYFTGLDDLQRQTLDRFKERFAPLFDIPRLGEGDLPTRVDRFVAARVRLFVEAAPIMRVARLRAIEHSTFLDAVTNMHATLAEQVRRQFACELASGAGPLQPDDLALAIDAMASPGVWDLMQVAHGRSPAQIATIWTAGITALISDRADDTPRAAAEPTPKGSHT
jgi:AcrR family transcriptional regulator